MRRFASVVVSVSAAVTLSTLAVPAAQAAPEPDPAPGLLVGTVIIPRGWGEEDKVKLTVQSPDGSNHRETDLPESSTGLNYLPHWAPDGNRISVQNAAEGLSIYRSDLSREIVNVAKYVSDGGVFTRDGAKLVTESYAAQPKYELAYTPSDWNTEQHGGASDLKPWLTAPVGGFNVPGSVSPTTGELFFSHEVDGKSDIWTDHATHTGGLLIADGRSPSVSPDGSTIAFVRAVDGKEQIFLQAADGSGSATQLTAGADRHYFPQWGADGRGLYYNANSGSTEWTAAGHYLRLADRADSLTGLINVSQQPVNVTSPGRPSGFHPLAPARLLDTRYGIGRPASGAVRGGQHVPLQITGRERVPTSGVSAVVLNLTVTDTTDAGHLTVWGDGRPQPATSNLNWDRAGQTISNLVTVPVPADGVLDIYTNTTAQVIADVQGYYAADATGSTFAAKSPTRILDTREALGVPARGPVSYGTFDLKVAGQNGIPADATAVVLNLTTAFTRNEAGYLEAYPAGGAVPTVSNVNWSSTGALLSGLAVVPIGADGKVSIKVNGTTDVVGDVFGWFSADPAGARFGGTDPARLLDTRSGGGPVVGGQTRSLQVTGANGVPAGVRAVVLNVTVTGTTDAGFLEAWASGTTRPPAASNVNWVAGQTIANQVVVPVGADGRVNLYVNSTTDVIVDVFGYFAA